jgi:hypothetical protein
MIVASQVPYNKPKELLRLIQRWLGTLTRRVSTYARDICSLALLRNVHIHVHVFRHFFSDILVPPALGSAL